MSENSNLTGKERTDENVRLKFNFGRDNIDINYELAQPSDHYETDEAKSIKLSINGREKSFFDLKDSEFFTIASSLPTHSEKHFQSADLSERLLAVDFSKTPPAKEAKIELLQGLLDKGYTAAGVSLMNYYKREELALRQQGKTDDALNVSRQFDEISKKVDNQFKKSIDYKKITQQNFGSTLGLDNLSALIKAGNTDKKAIDLMKASKQGKSTIMKTLLTIGAPAFCLATFGIGLTTLAVGGLGAFGLYRMIKKEKAFSGENAQNLILGMKAMRHATAREAKAAFTGIKALTKEALGKEKTKAIKTKINNILRRGER